MHKFCTRTHYVVCVSCRPRFRGVCRRKRLSFDEKLIFAAFRERKEESLTKRAGGTERTDGDDARGGFAGSDSSATREKTLCSFTPLGATVSNFRNSGKLCASTSGAGDFSFFFFFVFACA